MRSRTTRCTFAELNQAAAGSPHPFQAQAAREMLGAGWGCYGTKTVGGVTVVFMRKTQGPQSTFGVLYPDGSFSRVMQGRKTVSYSWARARSAAQATVRAGCAS